MSIDLYMMPPSAPCRAVRLVAAAVGVDLNLKFINLMKGEQFTPEFLKINPQHTVPVIDDNGFYLAESRAISSYLVEKYGKNDSLYPKDIEKRAIVNQRLYFDIGTLYKAYTSAYRPVIFSGAPKDAELIKNFNESLNILDQFLENDDYVAGGNLTIADLSLVTTISELEILEHDFSKFKNINLWFARIKSEAPKYEKITGEGIGALKELLELLKK